MSLAAMLLLLLLLRMGPQSGFRALPQQALLLPPMLQPSAQPSTAALCDGRAAAGSGIVMFASSCCSALAVPR
jgi:hypothetical protein